MGTEIERKYLVKADELPDLDIYPRAHIVQGYVSLTPVVRVRIEQRLASPDFKEWEPEKAFLTVKGPGLLERAEFEYPISAKDAREMMRMSKTLLVHKTRYLIPHAYHTYEVDCFDWPFRGWLAEVELQSASESVELPPWVGAEVTEDSRYTNVSLVVNGFPIAEKVPAVVKPNRKKLRREPGMTIHAISRRTGFKSTELLMTLLQWGDVQGVHLNMPLDYEVVEKLLNHYGWELES